MTELNQVAAKRVKRLMSYLKREYKNSKDFTITHEIESSSTAVIKLSYNYFLDTKARKEFDIMADELRDACELHGEALAVIEGDSYFGGDFASMLIKPGKTIKCDALMSHIEIKLVYPKSVTVHRH